MDEKCKPYLDDLIDWLRIPTISGDPKYSSQMKEGANWLVERLEKMGFEARTMETSFQPVVYAELQVTRDKEQETKKSDQVTKNKEQKTKPTLLIYGHYDVQSPEPLDEWESEPFEPTMKNGNLYARGAADDKGQLYTWIAAIDQMQKENSELPFDVKFLVEGAEEEGSKGLAEFVAENKELLAADLCVISDTHCLSTTQPLITYGLRGLCYMEVTLECLKQDAHSGIYGGNIKNAANELAHLISKLKDQNSKVMVKGFYDDVRELTEKEVDELKDFPWTEKEIKEETGAQEIVGEEEFSIAARAGARPTLDVNGIWSGFTGEGSKTIIPAKASAKISMRLVPNQDPDDIAEKFERHVESLIPKGCKVTFKRLHGAKPILLNRDSKYFEAAEKAYEKVFGNRPLYELSGGSIGVVADFKEILGIDSILMGYGLPDDGLHSPNEKLSIDMFQKGIETNIAFLNLLASF